MPNTYVTEVDLKDGQLLLNVQVDEFATGDPVEIYGQATQDNAAFAPFYDIRKVPAPGANGHKVLTVQADPVDGAKFEAKDPVTVAVRVSAVWVTILTKANVANTGTGITAVWTENAVATLETYD